MKGIQLRRAIGYSMRTERLIHRKTLQQVADHLGISKSQVSLYETGKTPITCEMLNDYCEYIGVSMIDLLNNIDTHSEFFQEENI